MVSCLAKIGLKMSRKREINNYRSVPFLPDAKQKIPKKLQKNSKILKNTIMASLQAKIGWKWMRNRENKNYPYVSFCSVPTRRIIENSKKNSKKIQKYHYGIISSQNRLENAEKGRI